LPPDPAQVYQPAEDSFLLLRAALKELREEDRVLEVGTGSGYVAGTISGCTVVTATDINPHAVRTARQEGVEVVRTDLAAGLKNGSFDLILFNPPYLPTDPSERIDDWLEYALDGGKGGLDVVSRFLREIPLLLAPGGRILLLVSSLNNSETVRSLLRKTGWQCSVVDREILVDGEILFILRLIPVW
jgi:release factor glutamine methyltransferase